MPQVNCQVERARAPFSLDVDITTTAQHLAKTSADACALPSILPHGMHVMEASRDGPEQARSEAMQLALFPVHSQALSFRVECIERAARTCSSLA